jgi:ribonuclease HII
MTVIAPTQRIETRLRGLGHDSIVGMDEVGRGPLAGPVTVAAVLLPRVCRLPGVRDSKLMTLPQREQAATMICKLALGIGLGWASERDVDDLGLTGALRLAGARALANFKHLDMVILDGSHNYLGEDYRVELQTKADQTCLSVAAASVIAKVARDRYMQLLDLQYSEYGLAQNKGYGSAAHLAALALHGPASCHRRSFRPVREAALVHG